MMAFYQEHGINPFSSCLPVLLQMPVFIVLYQVLSGLTRRMDGDGSNFNPKYLEDDQGALAVRPPGDERDALVRDGPLPERPVELQNEGIITALPYIALVALVVFTSFVQQRQIQGSQHRQRHQPAAADDRQDPAVHLHPDLHHDPVRAW
jgi:YidC/Oxa1 family membrane protein insertase